MTLFNYSVLYCHGAINISVVTLCITSWYGNLSKNDKNKLTKILRSSNLIKLCYKILDLIKRIGINVDLPSLKLLERTVPEGHAALSTKMMCDQDHPLHNNYTSS